MINLCGENEERGDNDNEGRVFNDNWFNKHHMQINSWIFNVEMPSHNIPQLTLGEGRPPPDFFYFKKGGSQALLNFHDSMLV